MNKSENINELASALSKAQGEISSALKDNSNEFFNSKYADLNSVWNACREPLSKNGLCITQTTSIIQGGHILNTMLLHSSGQWIESSFEIILDLSPVINKYGKEVKPNPLHLMGSCLTYYRRYALAAIVGVAPDDDDDGNECTSFGSPINRKEEKKQTQQKVELATNEQINEIRKIIPSCSDELKNNINELLKTRMIKNFEGISLSLYHSLMKRINQDLQKNNEQIQLQQVAS